jgi:hypothetical protein
VADLLINELFADESTPTQLLTLKEQKNIRRRVYDALNVLKSARMIRKRGKAI